MAREGHVVRPSMSYRDPLCGFCRQPPVASCARCKAPVCAAHTRENAPWCAVCELERVDDVELAVAIAKLASPAMVDVDVFAGRSAGLPNLVSLVWHLAARPFRIRGARLAAERAFADKSRAEIEGWRASNFRPER